MAAVDLNFETVGGAQGGILKTRSSSLPPRPDAAPAARRSTEEASGGGGVAGERGGGRGADVTAMVVGAHVPRPTVATVATVSTVSRAEASGEGPREHAQAEDGAQA
eukprot:3396267-Rhodomonas_salina.1